MVVCFSLSLSFSPIVVVMCTYFLRKRNEKKNNSVGQKKKNTSSKSFVSPTDPCCSSLFARVKPEEIFFSSDYREEQSC